MCHIVSLYQNAFCLYSFHHFYTIAYFGTFTTYRLALVPVMVQNWNVAGYNQLQHKCHVVMFLQWEPPSFSINIKHTTLQKSKIKVNHSLQKFLKRKIWSLFVVCEWLFLFIVFGLIKKKFKLCWVASVNVISTYTHARTHMHACTRNQWTILYHNLKICILVLLETQISFGVLRKNGAFSWDVVGPSSDTGDCWNWF